jgi:hypothetical protein
VFARLRWRLLGWTMLVLTLILALVGSAVYVTLRQTLTAEVDSNLASRATEVAAEIYRFGAARVESANFRGGVFYLVAYPDGTIIDNPQHVEIQRLPLPLPTANAASTTTITVQGEQDRLLLLPLAVGPGDRIFLVTGESLAPQEHVLSSLLLVLIASAIGGLLLSLAVAHPNPASLQPAAGVFGRRCARTAHAAHRAARRH